MRTACHTVRAPKASATELRKEGPRLVGRLGEGEATSRSESETELSNNDPLETSLPKSYLPAYVLGELLLHYVYKKHQCRSISMD